MDILFVDITAKTEIDIDDRENISSIQNIIADEKNFYILANKKDAKLGSEEKWRRSSLFNSVNHNLQMHTDLQTKHKFDRLEMLKDKIDVQTSL